MRSMNINISEHAVFLTSPLSYMHAEFSPEWSYSRPVKVQAINSRNEVSCCQSRLIILAVWQFHKCSSLTINSWYVWEMGLMEGKRVLRWMKVANEAICRCIIKFKLLYLNFSYISKLLIVTTMLGVCVWSKDTLSTTTKNHF